MTFVLAARFQTPKRARAIYRQVEQTLYQGEESNLSVYNVRPDTVQRIAASGG